MPNDDNIIVLLRHFNLTKWSNLIGCFYPRRLEATTELDMDWIGLNWVSKNGPMSNSELQAQ